MVASSLERTGGKMKCSKCWQEIPIAFCPLLKTDCMKGDKLPCRKYPSPQCSNEEAPCNLNGTPDSTSERRCGICGYMRRVKRGSNGIKIMVCEISGSMVFPIQLCYKPEKWWKAIKKEQRIE